MKKWSTLLVAAVVVVQFAALSSFALRWYDVARNGDELRFKCRFYDPYDPFRGKFVRVNPEVPEFVTDKLGDEIDSWSWRDDIWVKVEASNDGDKITRIVDASFERGEDGLWINPEETRVVTAGEEGKFKVRIRLPDQLFLNERLAPEAENVVRNNNLNIVAVYKVKGDRIILTDILAEGKPLCEYVKEKMKAQQ